MGDLALLEERQQLEVELPRFLDFFLEHQVSKARDQRGRLVRNDGNHARAAQGHEREREGIVTREDLEARRDGGEHFHLLGDRARSFLDANDVRDGGQARQGRGLDVGRRPARNVIEDHGQVGGLGDGREVLDKAFLRGLVVVGRDAEKAVDA